jgi:hypothetical protein
MKQLSESQKKIIKDYLTKKYNLKEGIIDYVFGKILVKKLKNDKNFVKLAKDLDKRLQTTKNLLQWHADKNQPLPDSIAQIINKGSN